jgi:tripartite-type tricarboxylate transporter receptor subunit TctC
MLAMERGEVEGATVNWTTVKTAKAQWLRENKVRVIVQHLPTRGPDLPDVPALGELGDTTEGRQLLSLYANTGPIGRAIFAPPGTAAGAVKTLRDGFIAMTRDPEFVADAKKINAELDIGTGDDVLKAVQQTLTVPEPVLQRAREIFGR